MKRELLSVISCRPLNGMVFELKLAGASAMRAGQFVELSVPGFFLRRPISVADSEADGTLTLLIKTVGEGTKKLRTLAPGDTLDALTGLGNGFDLDSSSPLLVGGGIGCAPLYKLAKDLAAAGVRPHAVLGFRNAEEMYYVKEFERYCDVTVATDDGSAGVKGNAVTASAGIPHDRFLRLRAAGNAAGSGRDARTRAGQPRGEDGLRFRRLHGVQHRHDKGICARVQGRSRLRGGGGGVVRDTTVSFLGYEMKNPVVPASGTFGFGWEFAEYYDIDILGSMSLKGTTAEARYGNPLPRIAECTAGLINAIGLQNPGVAAVIGEEIPRLDKVYHGKVIANVGGHSVEEYVTTASAFNDCDKVFAVELNISCPNVKGGGMAFGTDAKIAKNLVYEVKKSVTKPLIVKLSPNVTSIADMAKAAVDGGAGRGVAHQYAGGDAHRPQDSPSRYLRAHGRVQRSRRFPRGGQDGQ